MGPAALIVSALAAVLSASIWFSFVGAPIGMVGFGMGYVAVRKARERGERSWTGMSSLVVSTAAVLAFPFFLWACNAWLGCV